MVTAAVYWDLYSKQLNFLISSCSTGQESDPIHHFYNLAESCVFNKQSLPPILYHLKNINILRYSFSRSYGVNLPSSFNIIISHTLVFYTSLPVSV